MELELANISGHLKKHWEKALIKSNLSPSSRNQQPKIIQIGNRSGSIGQPEIVSTIFDRISNLEKSMLNFKNSFMSRESQLMEVVNNGIEANTLAQKAIESVERQASIKPIESTEMDTKPILYNRIQELQKLNNELLTELRTANKKLMNAKLEQDRLKDKVEATFDSNAIKVGRRGHSQPRKQDEDLEKRQLNAKLVILSKELEETNQAHEEKLIEVKTEYRKKLDECLVRLSHASNCVNKFLNAMQNLQLAVVRRDERNMEKLRNEFEVQKVQLLALGKDMKGFSHESTKELRRVHINVGRGNMREDAEEKKKLEEDIMKLKKDHEKTIIEKAQLENLVETLKKTHRRPQSTHKYGNLSMKELKRELSYKETQSLKVNSSMDKILSLIKLMEKRTLTNLSNLDYKATIQAENLEKLQDLTKDLIEVRFRAASVIEKENNQLKKKIQEMQAELKNKDSIGTKDFLLKRSKLKIEELSNQLKTANGQINELEKELEEVKGDKRNMKIVLDGLKQTLNSMVENCKSDIQEELNRVSQNIRQLHNLTNKDIIKEYSKPKPTRTSNPIPLSEARRLKGELEDNVNAIMSAIGVNNYKLNALETTINKLKKAYVELLNSKTREKDIIRNIFDTISLKTTQMNKKVLESLDEKDRNKLNFLENIITKLKSTLADKNNSIEDFKKELNEREEEIKQIQSKEADLIKEIETKVLERDEAIKELNTMKADNQRTIEELEAELDKMKEDKESNIQKIQELEEEYKAKVLEKEEQLKEMQKVLKDDTESQIKFLQDELNTEQNKVKMLEISNNEKTKTIEDINTELEQKVLDIDELNKKLSDEITKTTKLKAKYNTQIEELTKRYNDADQSKKELEEEIKELEKQLSKSENEIKSKEENIKDLKTINAIQVTEFETKRIAEEKNTKETVNELKEDYETRIRTLNELLEAKNELIKDVEANAKNKLNEIKNDIESYKDLMKQELSGIQITYRSQIKEIKDTCDDKLKEVISKLETETVKVKEKDTAINNLTLEYQSKETEYDKKLLDEANRVKELEHELAEQVKNTEEANKNLKECEEIIEARDEQIMNMNRIIEGSKLETSKELNELNTQFAEEKSKLREMKRVVEELKSNNAKVLEEKNVIIQSITTSYEEQLAAKQKHIKDIECEHEESIKKLMNEYDMKIKELDTMINNIQNENEELKKELETNKQSLSHNILKNEELIEEYNANESKANELIEKLQKENEELIHEVVKKQEENKTLSDSIGEQKLNIQQLLLKEANGIEEINKLNIQLNEVNEKVMEKERNITELKTQCEQLSDVMSKEKNKVDSLKTALKFIEGEVPKVYDELLISVNKLEESLVNLPSVVSNLIENYSKSKKINAELRTQVKTSGEESQTLFKLKDELFAELSKKQENESSLSKELSYYKLRMKEGLLSRINKMNSDISNTGIKIIQAIEAKDMRFEELLTKLRVGYEQKVVEFNSMNRELQEMRELNMGEKKIIDELNKQLREYEVDYNEKIKTSEETINALNAQVIESKNRSNELSGKLQETTKELGEMKELNFKAKEREADYLKEIENTQKVIEELSTKHETIKESLLKNIEELNATHLEDIEELNVTHGNIVEEMKTTLKQKDSSIEELNRRVQEKEENITFINEELEVKNKEIEEKSNTIDGHIKEIEENREILNELNNKLNIQDSTIEQITNNYKKKQEETADTNRRLGEAEILITEMEIEFKEAISNKDTELTELNDILKKKDVLIDEANSRIKEYESEIEKLNEELRKADSVIEKIKSELTEKKRIIADENIKIKKQEIMIENLDKELVERDTIINDKRQALTEKEKAITELKEQGAKIEGTVSELEATKGTVNELNIILSKKEESLDELNDKIKAKNSEIEAIGKKLEENDNTIHQLINKFKEQDTIIKERDKTIKELSNEVKENERLINDTNNKLKEKEEMIESISKSLGERGSAINDKLKEKESIIEELSKNIREKDKLIDEVNSKLKEKDEVIMNVGKLLEEIKGKSEELLNKTKDELIAKIEDINTKLKDKEDLIIDKNKKLEEAQETIDRIKTNLKEKEDALSEISNKLKEVLNNREESINKLNKTIEDKETHINEINNKLEEEIKANEDTSKELSARELNIKELNTQLNIINDEVRKKEKEIEELNLRLREKEETNTKLKESEETLSARVTEKEEVIDSLSKKLKENEDIIEETEKRLEDKESIITELKDKLTEKEELVKKLEGSEEESKKVRVELEGYTKTNISLKTEKEKALRTLKEIQSAFNTSYDSLKETMDVNSKNNMETMSKMKEKMKSIIERHIKDKAELEQFLISQKQELDQKAEEVDKCHSEIYRLTKNQNTLIESSNRMYTQITQFKSFIMENKEVRDNTKSILGEMCKLLINGKEQMLNSLGKKLNAIKELEIAKSKLEDQHKKDEKEIQNYLNTIIPLKGENVELKQSIDNLQIEIESYKQQLEKVVNEKETQKTSVSQSKSVVNTLQNELSNKVKKLNEVQSNYNKLLNEKQKTKESILKLRTLMDCFTQVYTDKVNTLHGKCIKVVENARKAIESSSASRKKLLMKYRAIAGSMIERMHSLMVSIAPNEVTIRVLKKVITLRRLVSSKYNEYAMTIDRLTKENLLLLSKLEAGQKAFDDTGSLTMNIKDKESRMVSFSSIKEKQNEQADTKSVAAPVDKSGSSSSFKTCPPNLLSKEVKAAIHEKAHIKKLLINCARLVPLK